MKSHFSFDTNLAVEYGVDGAILIHNFQFWLTKNKANETNTHDGRTWTFNTQKALCTLFPFWSTAAVKRILKNLIDKGVLITGKYNKKEYDNTTWYAFKDEAKFLANTDSLTIAEIDHSTSGNQLLANTAGLQENEKTQHSESGGNGHKLKSATPLAEIDQPIPDTTINKSISKDIQKAPKKKTSRKIDIATWENQNGLLTPADFPKFIKDNQLTKEQMGNIIETFRAKVLAGGYKYVDFKQTLRAWGMETEIRKLKQGNHGNTANRNIAEQDYNAGTDGFSVVG